MAKLVLTREQILGNRQRVGMLGRRGPSGLGSLHRAARAGLQDSMPRAALLSIHARVEDAHPRSWEDPGLIQIWGPRYSAYVIAESDLAVFTLGRLPEDPSSVKRAYDIAARLQDLLGDQPMAYRDAGDALGVSHNSLRYAAPTGTVLIRWEGSGKPTVWTVPPPDVDPAEARLELARRHLAVFGPSTPITFAKWAGVKPAAARRTFEELGGDLTPVETPIGDRFILTTDEEGYRPTQASSETVRLLPSGDSYWLCHGPDRDLLVPDPAHRDELWTPRVWPGACFLNGEIVGIWRRTGRRITMEFWTEVSDVQHEAFTAEAANLPIGESV